MALLNRFAMFRHRLPVILFTLLFASCSSGTGKNEGAKEAVPPAAAVPFDNTLPKGKVLDSVSCINGSRQTFALYLPKAYTPQRKWPVIFFFDAHARGSLPLHLYSAIAEQYGFILVGSSYSRNGMPWAENFENIKEMLASCRAEFHIDSQQQYGAGFSGGSRVASTLALSGVSFSGVIGCAAGFPKIDPANSAKFSYFGIVGDYDFNLGEMKQLDEQLAQSGYHAQLLTLNGNHGWPPAKDFEMAVQWVTVVGMRDEKVDKDPLLMHSLAAQFRNRITEREKAGDWVKVHELLFGLVGELDGFEDISKEKMKLTELEASDKFKTAMNNLHASLEKEQQLEREMVSNMGGMGEKGCIAAIADLRKKVSHAANLQEAQMYQRVLNYLGLVFYMTSDNAIKNHDFPSAGVFLNVFKNLDPKNPDVPYLGAAYFMAQGNTAQVYAQLQHAVDLGFNQLATISFNPMFDGLKGQQQFQKLLEQIKSNIGKGQ